MELQAFDHPAAWHTGDLGGVDALAVDLEDRHITALCEALRTSRRGARCAGLPEDSEFVLEGIEDDIAAWREQVRNGRGFVLLRGFPVTDLPLDDVEAMYYGLGQWFGRPVSQSNMGDLVGHVVDVGGKDTRERAYRNSAELRLHTDRCDHLGMLCIRPAMSGGVSGYASALTIHNEMLATRPDLLQELYRGFRLHRFGEQGPGEPPVTDMPIPVVSVADGAPCVVYLRGYIDLAVQEGHCTLTASQREALDYLDALSNREDIRLDFTMQPGDLLFFNNCLLLHTRTAFEDSPDPALRRHLLRLWLMEDGRPAVEGVRAHKGKGGIPPQKGRGTFYETRGQLNVT
jgi:hypothetical protein